MLSLTINDKREKLNVGCRTFISLYELLHLLEIPGGKRFDVYVNSNRVEPGDFMLHKVSSGDVLAITYH